MAHEKTCVTALTSPYIYQYYCDAAGRASASNTAKKRIVIEHYHIIMIPEHVKEFLMKVKRTLKFPVYGSRVMYLEKAY